MKAKIFETFDNVSDLAMVHIIDSCKGTPVVNSSGETIGSVLSGTRIDGTNDIEFEIELIPGGVI